uniref:Cellulase n=1 Tax=bacterium enrichment culture clone CelA12 TaxID=645755 RepID=C5HG54_9BACT|nr:cellulase [bacterium enrichment culture clone CelA12]
MPFLLQNSFLLKKKPLTALVISLGLCASAAQAQTAYNDAWWSSPNSNTNFVDHFNGNSINRTKWLVEKNIFVNGEDIDYQDVEYPTPDWTIRTGQDDAGALDGKVLNLQARYMDGQIQDYYGGVVNGGKPLFIRAGRIESPIADESTFVFGKFEARIKMPPARNGEFPAWWLFGNFPDVGWTACQELDIIEFTGNNASKAPQTRWSAPYPAYGGNPFGTTYAQLGINPSSQYITYGVIKTPEFPINSNGNPTAIRGIDSHTLLFKQAVDDSEFSWVTNHTDTHERYGVAGEVRGSDRTGNVLFFTQPFVEEFIAQLDNPIDRDFFTAQLGGQLDGNFVGSDQYYDVETLSSEARFSGKTDTLSYVGGAYILLTERADTIRATWETPNGAPFNCTPAYPGGPSVTDFTCNGLINATQNEQDTTAWLCLQR